MPDVALHELTDSWSGGGPFDAIKMSVTDGGSTADSKLLDLLVGGVSKFSVSKAGNTTIAGTLAVTGAITATGGVTGNASTATALATARTINGVSFDGTGNITVADATKLPLSGGTMTGAITFDAGQTWPTFNQNTTGSAASLSSTLAVASGGTGQTTYTDGQLLIGNSNNNSLTTATLTAGNNVTITNGNGSILIESTGGGGGVSSVGLSFTNGLISVAGSPITSSGTLALTVAGNSGGIPYFDSGSSWASSAALTQNALVIGGGAGSAPSTTTTGTGVLTALGVNTGTAGAFVVQDGALGTPTSGTVTNLTGTASININGTVGATTPAAGAFTTLSASQAATFSDTVSVGGSNCLLTQDAADVLALRRTTNAQAMRIYNTFTDASNHERAFARWSTNVFEIGTEREGTGAIRALKVGDVRITSHTAFAITAVDISTETLTVPGHNFVNDAGVRFPSLGSITGLSTSTQYYVVQQSGDTLKVSTTVGGAAVNLGGSLGSGPTIVLTQSQTRIEADGPDATMALCLVPKGGGAVAFRRITGSPNNGDGGANPLGVGAIDLQAGGSQTGSQCASGAQSAILGGVNNSASASRATVVGGIGNAASGSESIVLGGSSNTASASFSVASGQLAEANRYGQRCHAVQRFGSSGRDAFHNEFVLMGKTTTGSATEMFLNNISSRLTIASGYTQAGTIKVAGVTSGNEKANIYVREYVLKNRGGTTALEGSVQTIGTDIKGLDVTGPTITADDTNDALKIEVTGFAPVTGMTGEADDDVITKTDHGFVDNDDIVFTTLTGGAGLTASTVTYWVRDATANTFKVSATRGGTAVDITTDYTDMVATRLMRWMAVVDCLEFLAGT